MIEENAPFLVSSSIENLCRLELIVICNDVGIAGYNYSSFEKHELSSVVLLPR